MNKDLVVKIAQEAGFGNYAFEAKSMFECFAQSIRNEVLEEAAQKAFSWNTAMTDVLANEIRNLKEQP